MALKKLEIAYEFIEAFGRDVDYDGLCEQSTYLDIETGEMIWIYEDNEDAEFTYGVPKEENMANKNRVEGDPERYLEVKGLDHGEHHDILLEFLDSYWTEDEELRRKAKEAYSGSIGGWKDAVHDDDALYSYYDFRDRKIEAMADEFLRKNGIELVNLSGE